MEAYTAPPKPAPKGRKGGGAAPQQAAPTTDVLLGEINQLITDLTAYSVTEWASVKHLWEEETLGGMWRIKAPSSTPVTAQQTQPEPVLSNA